MTSWTLAAAFTALIVLGGPQEAEPEPVSSGDAPKLAWIVGTWERTDGDKTTVEHWLPHAGTTMMGLSHTYDSKRTHFFERHAPLSLAVQRGEGMAPRVGLEPTTLRLTAECSTIELSGIAVGGST